MKQWLLSGDQFNKNRHQCGYDARRWATTLNPLTGEVNIIEHKVTMQRSAGEPWVQMSHDTRIPSKPPLRTERSTSWQLNSSMAETQDDIFMVWPATEEVCKCTRLLNMKQMIKEYSNYCFLNNSRSTSCLFPNIYWVCSAVGRLGLLSELICIYWRKLWDAVDSARKPKSAWVMFFCF